MTGLRSVTTKKSSLAQRGAKPAPTPSAVRSVARKPDEDGDPDMRERRLKQRVAGSLQQVSIDRCDRQIREGRPNGAFLPVGPTTIGLRLSETRKVSLKIDVDGCPLYSASRKQKARPHSSGELEPVLFREVLLFMGLEVQTELLPDSAAARGMCRRERAGTTRHLSTKVFWLQRADLETKSLPLHKLQQMRQWNRPVLDQSENSVNGDTYDGQDEKCVARRCGGNCLRSWER